MTANLSFLDEDNDSDLLFEIKKNQITMTDDDGQFQVYCAKAQGTEFDCRIRGYIFQNEKLVYRGFPFTEEMTTNEKTRLNSLDLKTLNMSWSYEGSILKFLYLDNRWYMTTHRKLDAFNSTWGSKTSFGVLFVKALSTYGYEDLNAFTEALDKKTRYHFLLINNEENRVVVRCELQKEKIYLVLTTDEKDVPIKGLTVDKIPINPTVTFETIEELVTAVENIDPFEKQGIFLFSDDYRLQYRILNASYYDYSSIRNNSQCLIFCYAVNRNDEEKKTKFHLIYPEAKDIADWYEKRLEIIAKEIFSVYKKRYIRHQYFHQSRERHGILRSLDANYQLTRQATTLTTVKHKMNTYSPSLLYKIVMKRDKVVIK